MSYPRFFVLSEKINGSVITLDGESAQHVSRSLRMRAGEKIVVCDENKNEYECELASFTSDTVEAKIMDMKRSVSEPLYNAVVYQACPKGDKMDSIVQKAVELGACGIVAFVSDRCIAKYDGTSFPKKCARWQKIALEAAKQSGRGSVPFVRWLPNIGAAIEEAAMSNVALVCYEEEDKLTLKELLKKNKGAQSISFIIGPEGGLSANEVDMCREKGIHAVTLGNRILRTETASSYVLSCLSYEMEL
ncbi:MAG: 16S rRNA (uracil(1498)-N(3))-methyltransferase [Clostridia bacterium]|nr:16S rRNA (uracil(1498)-N(3))-methyltransferase [Clostridia bacterium]